MTTDPAPTDAEVDAAERHRALRAQWIEQQRQNGDGHNRRSTAGASMADLRRRRQRRRAAARLRAQAS